MANLTKTRTILHFRSAVSGAAGNVAVFRPAHDDDDAGRGHVLNLDYGVWQDMGNPSVITVTIEPGDVLNETT